MLVATGWSHHAGKRHLIGERVLKWDTEAAFSDRARRLAADTNSNIGIPSPDDD
jgi:hypothetical protein